MFDRTHSIIIYSIPFYSIDYFFRRNVGPYVRCSWMNHHDHGTTNCDSGLPHRPFEGFHALE